jgi:hypothetical protein
MFDSNPCRHRCRNPRCKTWLKEPVASPRDAFCCASCETGFYRSHCRVCETALGDAKRNSRRELCGGRQCRNQFRSFRMRFFSVWYPNATRASKPEKSSTKSTLKTGIKSDRGFAIKVIAGPVENYSARSLRAAGLPLDRITANYHRRLDRIRRETAWRPKRVDLPQSDAPPSDWRPCLPSDWQSLPDLPIPPCLRRVAS